MTALDIFVGVICIGLFVSGIFTMSLGFADWYVIGVIQNFNAGLPASVNPGSAVASLLSFSSTFSTFMPTLSVILMIVLIAETWMLSAFIKSHPLAAVVGIVSLIFYTIASFFISNIAIQVARLPIFANYVGYANPLLVAFIYAPYILVIATLIDLTIGIVAARQ